MNLDIRCIISILYRRVLIKLRSSRWTWWSRRTILTLGSRLCYFVRAQCYLASSYWSIYIYIYIYKTSNWKRDNSLYIPCSPGIYIYIYTWTAGKTPSECAQNAGTFYGSFCLWYRNYWLRLLSKPMKCRMMFSGAVRFTERTNVLDIEFHSTRSFSQSKGRKKGS